MEQHRKIMAMRGWAEWKPKALWEMRRTLLLVPSRRALVRRESMKARMPSRCFRTVRARRTKGGSRQRWGAGWYYVRVEGDGTLETIYEIALAMDALPQVELAAPFTRFASRADARVPWPDG